MLMVDVAAPLARGRAMAEALMVDECVVRRRTGAVTDPDTAVVTPEYTVVYVGKCRIQQPTSAAREESPGQAVLLMLRFELQVPISAVGIAADDEVLLTASQFDPDLVDREFVVRGLSHKTHPVMRRVEIEERTS
ncbi:DUF6093 family protein [Micromonospora sp. DT229]|uniref:DUF6093 family protein n=1 Tax=Micromonospora sp. DT229 TaxID=3393430 RepID=UPI003CFB9651